MALRNIVVIDEDKCNGCGQCVTACAEGAIEIVDGKAKLISEVYCDGLGACLGHCPEDAITVEQREGLVHLADSGAASARPDLGREKRLFRRAQRAQKLADGRFGRAVHRRAVDDGATALEQDPKHLTELLALAGAHVEAAPGAAADDG